MSDIASVLDPLDNWAFQCHAASLHLVRSGVLPSPCRVARGTCEGVGGQHSWVVLSDDVYDRDAIVVDPTLWSYVEDQEDVWIGPNRRIHTPHGAGSIWEWGKPEAAMGLPVELRPRRPWSRAARGFLELLGPLDLDGWIVMAHAPMEGWPSREIVDAMCELPELRRRIPIDIVGMLTDRNPSGLYLFSEDA